MMIFWILACACAALFAISLHSSLLSADESSKTMLARLIEAFGLLILVVACGAIQYWKMTSTGATSAKLWLAVAGTAIGAPIAGIVLMFIVSFALASKSP
jgi:hypothetical protein